MLVTSHQPVRRREILVELSYRCQGLPSSDLLPPVKLSYIAAIYHNREINLNHVQTLEPVGDISHPDPTLSP